VPQADPTLDGKLRAAHEAQDAETLVTLYCEAATQAGCDDARGFFLTHAYIYALELGDARAAPLKAQLIALRRERA
jgi:hypothetical protein